MNHDTIADLVSEVAAEKTIHDNDVRLAAAVRSSLRKKIKRPVSAPVRGVSTRQSYDGYGKGGGGGYSGMIGEITSSSVINRNREKERERSRERERESNMIDLETNLETAIRRSGGSGTGSGSNSGSNGGVSTFDRHSVRASTGSRGSVRSYDLDTAYRALSIDPMRVKSNQNNQLIQNQIKSPIPGMGSQKYLGSSNASSSSSIHSQNGQNGTYVSTYTGNENRNSNTNSGSRRPKSANSIPIRQVRCRGTSAVRSSTEFKLKARNNNHDPFAAFKVLNGIGGSRSPSYKTVRTSSQHNLHRSGSNGVSNGMGAGGSNNHHNINSNLTNYTDNNGHSHNNGHGNNNHGRAPVSFMVLDGSDSLYNQAVSAAAAMALQVPKGENRGENRGFIPGGNTEGKEFNVVARGSKIARATTHFNAAVAAR